MISINKNVSIRSKRCRSNNGAPIKQNGKTGF